MRYSLALPTAFGQFSALTKSPSSLMVRKKEEAQYTYLCKPFKKQQHESKNMTSAFIHLFFFSDIFLASPLPLPPSMWLCLCVGRVSLRGGQAGGGGKWVGFVVLPLTRKPRSPRTRDEVGPQVERGGGGHARRHLRHRHQGGFSFHEIKTKQNR